MPNPHQRTAAWKPAHPASTPAATPPTDVPAWRQASTGTRLPPRVRVARLAGVLALILATAGLLVWLILWLAPPGPAVLVLAGAGYEDNLAVPQNAAGREAMSRLGNLAGTSAPLSWFFRRSGRLRLSNPPQEFRRDTDWAKGLDDARESTVIVFLPMHGGADAKGAYLLPQDASADPRDRIRLEAILDRLGELPAHKHKLLLLDATAMTPDWTMGLLHNDFARVLAELDDKIAAIPNLIVMSASGVDQRSWPAADLRTSLFARHLFEGMLGRADADKNGHIHAWEVYQYLAGKVEADALRLHGVTQTPVLLPVKDGEARARALSMTFQLDEAALEGDPVGEPLADIQSSWASYDTFRPRAAAARACVPGAWELWQSWLVRHEQVRLAGSPLSGKIAEKAREAAQRVRQGLDLSLASGSLTLEMPAVEGETRLVVPYPYGSEDRLWQANPADRRTVWQSLREGSDSLLRRNILYALIRRAAENPTRNLDRAAELVKLLDDPVSVVRPAEAHFLVLLQRDLPVRPIPEELNTAIREGLRVRLLAEEAALAVEGDGYAYSERIRPWVSVTVTQADMLRQRGEDLLFASENAQWSRALDLLKQAGTLYQKAKADTAGLRECLAVCDRALAELPAFAHWVAHQPDDDLLTKTLTLFEQTRQLDAVVQDVVTQRETGKVEMMRKQAQAARDGLDLLQTRLDAFARNCETSRSSPLRDGGVALRIPWLDAGVRSRLLLKLSRLAKQARSESEANVEVSPGQLDEVARRRAVREGRLAMAALGPRWFDESRAGTMPYADVEPFLRRPDLEGVWPKVLRWAGDEIGSRYRAYPARVEQLIAAARKRQEVAGPLREADRLQRHLDAGQWQFATQDAPSLARRADVEVLLVWQGERTLTDHWYNDDPATAPYYRITGVNYLRDARRLDPFGRADAPGGEALRKHLEAPDGLRVTSAPPKQMIVGDRLTITSGLTSAGSPPTGLPVMWAVPGDKLAFARLQEASRAVVTPESEQVAVTLSSPDLERAEQSPPLDATAEPSDVTWRAYYRGQKPSQATPVSLYPVAESTRDDYQAPPRAGIALRATDPLFARFGRAQGGLAIVVDCSGSEGTPPPANAATRSRFRQAVASLRTVLGRVPPGTRLSLWVFGQAVPPRNTVERAEETIQQLRAPAVWAGGNEAVEALVGQVAALEPWNESPVARAVLRAREDLLKVEGFRDLILLSDGDDNRFAKDAEANPKKEPIPDVLTHRFAETNIALHVVGFAGADGQPEAALQNNFSFVTTRLPKGTISTVSNLAPLLDAMKFTMPAGLRYRLSGGGDETSSDVVEVSREDENDRWTIVSGGTDPYRLSVPLMEFDRRMTLRNGDFVLLDLDQSDGGWRRRIWSLLDPFRLRPARQAGGWRVAVMQDQIVGERALQMLVTVEKESPRTADPGQVWPGAVWLEVSPTGSKANPAVRWGKAAGFPAPAWSVDAPGWPIGDQLGPPSPDLRAWWGDVSAASLVLRRPVDFDHLDELRGPRAIGEERFTIDRATVEEHWVQVRTGMSEKRWCVVIGAAHDVGKPVWANLDGVEAAGQEHRTFRAAGRYMGLFWFTDAASEEAVRKKVERELTAVRVVSVTAFKAEATKALQQATFADLDSPAALPPRPRPVWP